MTPDEKMTGSILPDVDPAAVSGTIYAAGSSTVYPLTEAIAENFKADGFTGEIKIDSIGSGAGFERFCKSGETDIANASRAIKSSEVESCKAIGRTPIEFRVGIDALAVVVSNKNTFVTNVTIEELGMIFGDKAKKWSDIRPDWPNEDILRFTPGTDSGTFDFFVEEVIQKPNKIEKLDDAKKIVLAASNLQLSEDDNVLVQGVEGTPTPSATLASLITRTKQKISKPSPSMESHLMNKPRKVANTPSPALCSSTPTRKS